MTSLRHSTTPENADAYLDAARAAILDLGWRRTTLTEVARRAGVSRMTIYRAWPDMPTLLGDLLTREWAELVAATATTRPDGTAADRVAAELVAVVRSLRENELLWRILELDPELLLPYLLSRRGRSQQATLDLLEDQLRAGQQLGEIRPGDVATLARALLLAAHGFVISAQTMTGEGVDEDALTDQLAELVARGLRP